MSIRDVLKNSFVEKFLTNISIIDIILTLGIASIFSIIIYFIYKITSKGVIYSKKFNVTMALMSIVTSGVVLSMQANIVVSLGMVGALSIVRFRTAIKEPRDLLFLFWSISNGIIIGAGIYSVAAILAVIVIIVMLILERLPENKMPHLLIVNFDDKSIEEKISNIFDNNNIKRIVKSKNISQGRCDVVYEIAIKEDCEFVSEIAELPGVLSVNLLHQDGECEL